MAQKKEGQSGKGVKMQDLAPKKDAKGGAARKADGGQSMDGGRGMDGSRGLNKANQSLDGGTRGLN